MSCGLHDTIRRPGRPVRLPSGPTAMPGCPERPGSPEKARKPAARNLRTTRTVVDRHENRLRRWSWALGEPLPTILATVGRYRALLVDLCLPADRGSTRTVLAARTQAYAGSQSDRITCGPW